MAGAQKFGTDFKHYPNLDADEFAEVCHHIDRRYTQATLGPVRRKWKLRVCRALDVSFSTSAEYATYVQIIRPLDGELDDGGLSSSLDNFSFGDGDKDMTSTEDHEMAEAEQADSVWLKLFRLQVLMLIV
jgi:ubiquitin-like-conjugating enzyme ATG10